MKIISPALRAGIMYTKIGIAVILALLSVTHATRDCPWKIEGEFYCGSDGKTYTSLCAIKEAMLFKGYIEVMHKGRCSGHFSNKGVLPSKSVGLNYENGINKLMSYIAKKPKTVPQKYQLDEVPKDVETKDYMEGVGPDEIDNEYLGKGKKPKDESEQYDESDYSMKPKKPKENHKGEMQRPKEDSMENSETLEELNLDKKKLGKNRKPILGMKVDSSEEEASEYSSSEDSYSADQYSEEVVKPRPNPKKPRQPKYKDTSYENIHIDNDAINDNYINIGSSHQKGTLKRKINNKAHNVNKINVGE